MTVRHDEAIVTAAHTVHDEVWRQHWRKGEIELRPAQVIEYVREVRTGAHRTEQALPDSLQKLVATAREAQDENKMIRLVDLIEPLKQIILPPVSNAA